MVNQLQAGHGRYQLNSPCLYLGHHQWIVTIFVLWLTSRFQCWDNLSPASWNTPACLSEGVLEAIPIFHVFTHLLSWDHFGIKFIQAPTLLSLRHTCPYWWPTTFSCLPCHFYYAIYYYTPFSSPALVVTASLKLHTFWTANAPARFHQAEAQFDLCHITAEDMHYYHVVAAFDVTTLVKNAHLLPSLTISHWYIALIAFLIDTYGLSEDQCAPHFLAITP